MVKQDKKDSTRRLFIENVYNLSKANKMKNKGRYIYLINLGIRSSTSQEAYKTADKVQESLADKVINSRNNLSYKTNQSGTEGPVVRSKSMCDTSQRKVDRSSKTKMINLSLKPSKIFSQTELKDMYESQSNTSFQNKREIQKRASTSVNNSYGKSKF